MILHPIIESIFPNLSCSFCNVPFQISEKENYKLYEKSKDHEITIYKMKNDIQNIVLIFNTFSISIDIYHSDDYENDEIDFEIFPSQTYFSYIPNLDFTNKDIFKSQIKSLILFQ